MRFRRRKVQVSPTYDVGYYIIAEILAQQRRNERAARRQRLVEDAARNKPIADLQD